MENRPHAVAYERTPVTNGIVNVSWKPTKCADSLTTRRACVVGLGKKVCSSKATSTKNMA